MAEVIDELVVRIMGDASEFEATINGISSKLAELERQQSGGNRSRLAENTSRDWEKTGKTLKQVGEGVDTLTKPIQYASVALATGGAAAAKFAVDFEDNFAAVKKTVEGTPEELAKIKQEIIDMSTVGVNGHSAIPQTTAELTELAAAGGQLGIQTENISEFTETMAMLGSATNLYGEQGAQTVARFMNVTNTSQDEIANLGSAVVDLGNNFATTEAEIADMALDMGATGSVVGISAQDVLAYSTALSSLGVDAAAGGSAVSRIWMDIQSAVSAGGEGLQKFAKLSGKSSKEFAQQWENDASGAFRDFLKGLNESPDQVSILSELGFNNIRDIQALQRLAGEKGFDLLTEAIKRSNTAWEENTALQTEFDAKAETTASQIQITKNNLVEAARSFGETFLPTIRDVSGGVAEFAQGLASMDDNQKKTLVNTGATIIALGAISKGVAGALKGVGNTMEAVGKIKEAMSAGGALAKAAPMLTGIASAAGPAALGVAGIAAAVVVGKSAYDAWYNSNYKFADGLSNTAKEISSYKDKCQELNDLQWEHKDLSVKINSEELNGEELENAKNRLEEIERILKEKYSIDINTENLDEAIEKAKELEKLEFLNKKKELRNDIDDLAPDYKRATKELPQLEADYNKATAAADAYKNAMTQVAQWQDDYDKGIIDAETYTSKFAEALNNLGRECGKGDKYGKKLLDEFSGAITGGLENPEFLSSWLQNQLYNFENELNVEGLKEKLDDAKATIEEYKEALQTLTAIDLSELKNDLNDGVISDTAAEAEIDSIIERLSTLDNGLKRLHENGKIDVQFNLDTGGLDIFDLNGTKLGEITAEGKINWKTGELPEIKDQDGKVIYYGDYSNLKAPTLRGTITYETAGFSASNVPWAKERAKGDMNFPGGLAKVNDDGKSDPRELIIDRGRAFIPEGRDVILSLSRGAKVYTSDQTKAIMSGLGIPHYAEGKNNSDAFTSARDNWSHYTKTHSVTTAQELQKWLEFQKQYAENEKDIWDIEEQVFSLQQKLYSDRVKESEKWLAHEVKYNGMSAADYLAGIDRMKAYTAEYYAQGIINHEEYTDALAELDEKYIDKRKEQLSQMFDASSAYISEHTYFNDWENDDPLSAYNRVMERNREALANGELTQAEYDEYAKNLGSDMYNERVEQSKNWLEEQRKYFGLSDKEYVEGLNRIKAYTQEYYDKGLISRREYNENMTELNHSSWDEADAAHEDMLQRQQDYISDMRDTFQKQEQELRDSWTLEDRAADMGKVSAQLEIYAGSVTDAGMKKYAELEKEMQQLQREEELYNLQVKNNAVIEGLEADYEAAGAAKADFLKSIVTNTDIDVSGIVGSLTSQVESYGNNLETLLSTLISKFDSFKVENNSMTDNRKFSYNISQMTPEQIQDMLKQIVGR